MVATVINEEVGLIVLAVLCGLGLPFEMLSARAVLLTGLLYAQTLILIWKSERVEIEESRGFLKSEREEIEESDVFLKSESESLDLSDDFL